MFTFQVLMTILCFGMTAQVVARNTQVKPSHACKLCDSLAPFCYRDGSGWHRGPSRQWDWNRHCKNCHRHSRPVPSRTSCQGSQTTSIPKPSSSVVLSLTRIPPIDCQFSQNSSVPVVKLTPISQNLSLGFPNTEGQLVVDNPPSAPLLLTVGDDRMSVRYPGDGEWGVFSNGTVFHTPENCSETDVFYFSVNGQGGQEGRSEGTTGLKRQAKNIKDTVDIDLNVYQTDGSPITPDCDFSLVARCLDLDNSIEDDVQLYPLGPSEYYNTCEFQKADIAADCLATAAKVIKLITDVQGGANNAQNIIGVGDGIPLDSVCAAMAVALGISTLTSAGLLTPAFAAFLAACLASLDALQSVTTSSLNRIGPEAICKALGKDNPDGLFDISIFNIAAPGAPLIYTTAIVGVTPTDIREGLRLDPTQAGCLTTSRSSSTTSTESSTSSSTSSSTTSTTSSTSSSSSSSSSTSSPTSSTSTRSESASASPSSAPTCGLAIASACDPSVDCCASGLVCADSLCVPQCDEGTTVNCDPIPTRCQQECGATSTATV